MNKHIFTVKKLASKLAKTKAKLELLTCGMDTDLFSSLRVHVGKFYAENDLEEKKSVILKKCQKDLLELSRLEAVANLKRDRENLRTFFERGDVQALSFDNYNHLVNICHSHESSLIAKISKKHERKINFFGRNVCVDDSPECIIKPEKKIKHKYKRRLWRRERQKKKREILSAVRKKKLKEELERIKCSNLVMNFSSQEIPDEMYFYLALGSTFVPSKVHDKHDFVFDAKGFCRKLAWQFYFSDTYTQDNDNNTPLSDPPDAIENDDVQESRIDSWKTPAKLKIKGRSYPETNSKFCDKVMKKILSDVEGIALSNRKWCNLTHVERCGLKMCQKAVRDRKLYFTKADKGGAMLIFDADIVDGLIRSILNEEKTFTKLRSDPRARIKSEIKQSVAQFEQDGLLSRNDCFLISGLTEKGGMSHSHSFCVRKTHTYPLFKVHKLSEQNILDKVIPPVRMVTSGVGGPTYRLGMFIDNLLQPVVKAYCKGEMVKDTTTFLASLKDLENDGSLQNCSLIGTLDVDALYPSIKTEFVQEAILHALQTCTDYSTDQINMIIELVNISINNAVVHYRGAWFSPKVGIPTGGSDSGSIANIYVKWCLDCKILCDSAVLKYNKMDKRKRFLDDLWFLWRGCSRIFPVFLNFVNQVGVKYGITLKGEVDDMANFLDVSTMLVGNSIRTCLYVKPTDAKRYLHRKSDHSRHTFKSTPYSQFRRAVVICSDPDDRDHFLNVMLLKFIDSGYARDELFAAKEKALLIDRVEVLRNASLDTLNSETGNDALTFVINHDRVGSYQIRKLMKDNQEMINYLFGREIKVIVAERRNPNTGSLLFAKSGFAKEVGNADTQECGSSHGCLTCDVLGIEPTIVINDVTVKLDYSLNCGSEFIIYLYLCRHCDNPCRDGFYFGQSINCMRERANGHRACFNERLYKKSALSYHIWDKHREHFHYELDNFKAGIVKSVSPQELDRAEDFYVVATQADTMGLNRYKVQA